MAKFEFKFLDCIEITNISVKKSNAFEKQIIEIKLILDGEEHFISLDKSTSIKFAKNVRTEINKITEREDQNGK
jgi:hypothetical protein